MRGTLAASDITRSHGAALVLGGVSLKVGAGDRIGVVGPNGIGKTTFLRILAGLEEPDSGSVTRTPPSLVVGYLPQDRAADGGVSGGQAARSALHALIAADHDVLLLDEPTNDLDFAGLDLLERFLDRSRAGVVVVSHDRAFLDRTVTRVVEIEEGSRRSREYAGGWSAYESARARAREQQYGVYGRYDDEKRALEASLRLRRDQAHAAGRAANRRLTKALSSRARAAERRLERLERVEKPWEPWQLRLGLAPDVRSGEVVALLEGALVERGAFRIGPLDLELRWGDRLALTGPNGSGKTTLLQALLGRIPLASGRRRIGAGVVLGELDQARSGFAGDEPLLASFRREAGSAEEPSRTLLAKFGLGADDVLRPARSLSPGERTRAALAVLAARGVNCLVLDEPTNHLDVPAIEELERALAAYEGTLVLVSHDRRFLDAVGPTRGFDTVPGTRTSL